MAFWRHYYHLVWATKERFPLISNDVESELYKYIFGKITSLQCISYAIGGIDNHIHLVASIPPKLSIADSVSNVKGSSSYHLNHRSVELQTAFGWQKDYGSFTLGKRQLDHAIHYVLHQKQHHLQNAIIPALERDDREDEGPEPGVYRTASSMNTVREAPSSYDLLDDIL